MIKISSTIIIFIACAYCLAFASDITIPKVDSTTTGFGQTWPTPRFTDNGNGTVTDNLTHLMWMTSANCIGQIHPGADTDAALGDGRITWQHALNFIAALNAGTYDCNALTTYTDWRLPNRRELWSLVDFAIPSPDPPNGVPVLPAGNPFTNSESVYWTSSTYAGNTSYAWTVYLDYAYIAQYLKTNFYYVWPVRGGL